MKAETQQRFADDAAGSRKRGVPPRGQFRVSSYLFSGFTGDLVDALSSHGSQCVRGIVRSMESNHQTNDSQ